MSNKPEPGEYAPYQANYVNLVGDEPILDILTNLKESSFSFFTAIDAGKGDYAYAEGKWTIKEVLGHMIDAERTFAYRIFAFSRGTVELPGFEQDEYVANADFNSCLLKDLAAEFRVVRESNLYLYRSLTPQQLLATGIASGKTITVRALLYIAAGHELYHLQLLKERYLS